MDSAFLHIAMRFKMRKIGGLYCVEMPSLVSK